MEVMLRKSLVLKIKKTLANKTFMASKHNFRALFGVFWSHFIQMVLFFQSISLNKKHGVKCFHDLFEIKHTEFLHSCILPLLYIVISEIGISSLLIIDLVRTKLISFFWFIVSMEILITLENAFNQTSLFSKAWCHFQIDEIKGRSVNAN